MRLRSFDATAALILALTSLGSAGCSDALPTESRREQAAQVFTLSESAAKSFAAALADVHDRVLPTLTAVDAPTSLTPMLDDLSASIHTRDARALRLSIDRINIALADFQPTDEAAAGVASELDAIRLVLEQARLLADGPTAFSR
jgi:hypothetical protein